MDLQVVAVVTALSLLAFYLFITRKYSSLPSPGLFSLVYNAIKSYPEVQKDPFNFLWKLYKQHGKNGLMHLYVPPNINFVFVGEFETIKELYKNQHVQLRFVNESMRNGLCEERQARNKQHFPGRFVCIN